MYPSVILKDNIQWKSDSCLPNKYLQVSSPHTSTSVYCVVSSLIVEGAEHVQISRPSDLFIYFFAAETVGQTSTVKE